MAALERLVTSWLASAELHSFRDGATASEIEDFESSAGWKLPREWREFYAFANGADLFRGSLYIYPLLNDRMSLLEASDSFRNSDWPVPDELWVAGNNGQGDQFGLWLPSASAEAGPIVEMGVNFGMAIAGSSLTAFLVARTAFHLLSYNAPISALDALHVPPKLRSAGLNEEAQAAIGRWADPARPGGSDNPYAEDLDAQEVSDALGSAQDR